MLVTHPVNTVLQFVETINHQDLIRLVSLMPENHVFIDLAGKQQYGRRTMQRGWARYFHLCPEYRIHIGEVYLVDPNVIIIGRTTGSHLNQTPQDEIRSTIIWVARVNNELVEMWALFYDTPENRSKLELTDSNRYTYAIN